MGDIETSLLFSFGSTLEIEPRGLDGAIPVTTVVGGRAGMAVGGRPLGAAPGVTFISQEGIDITLVDIARNHTL